MCVNGLVAEKDLRGSMIASAYSKIETSSSFTNRAISTKQASLCTSLSKTDVITRVPRVWKVVLKNGCFEQTL
jgi:hypothetical protein